MKQRFGGVQPPPPAAACRRPTANTLWRRQAGGHSQNFSTASMVAIARGAAEIGERISPRTTSFGADPPPPNADLKALAGL